jgi:hypothetical protein
MLNDTHMNDNPNEGALDNPSKDFEAPVWSENTYEISNEKNLDEEISNDINNEINNNIKLLLNL